VPRVKANGIELEYETFGDPTAQPLVWMGHDLPERVWPEVIDAIDEIAHRVAPISRR
jgi:hypothetical protein